MSPRDTPLAELCDVSFSYPATGERRARPFALSSLSLAIGPGEIIGVIGPNSSGKTTLIRLLTRVLEPAAGAIRLDGVPIGRLSRPSWPAASRSCRRGSCRNSRSPSASSC